MFDFNKIFLNHTKTLRFQQYDSRPDASAPRTRQCHGEDQGEIGLREAGFLFCRDCTTAVRAGALVFAARFGAFLTGGFFGAALTALPALGAPAGLALGLALDFGDTVLFSLRLAGLGALAGFNKGSWSVWAPAITLPTACVNCSCNTFHQALGLAMADWKSGAGGIAKPPSSLGVAASG